MNVPSFYKYLQLKLKEHAKGSSINEVQVLDLFSRYHIPKILRKEMIKEMEALGLVRNQKFERKTMILLINCKEANDMNDMDSKMRRKLYIEHIVNS